MKKGYTSDRAAVSSFECEDIHSQAELLDRWNQSYSQLSSGGFKGGLSTFEVLGMRLFVEQMNQSVYQTGTIPEKRLGFGIPVRAPGRCSMSGEFSQPGDLIVFSGKAGFEFISPRDFRFLGVEMRVPEQHSEFAGLAHELEIRLHARRRVIRLDPGQAAALVELFQSMFQSAGRSSEDALAQTRLMIMQRQFIGSVIDGFDTMNPPGAAARSEQSHWAVIKRIRESVIEGPDIPLTVAELALRLNLSRRTIQNAVTRILDMSPLAYLRALRLSEVRREIGSAASVTEIATRWGFWHFGYFARDYRTMFGELPSDTLARSRSSRPRNSRRLAEAKPARPH